MEEFYSVLLACPLFQGIQREDLHGMLGCLQTRVLSVRKGQTVFREGDTTVSIGIVLTGSLLLTREDYDGNRSIVARADPKEMFGESYALSDSQPLAVTITAEEDSQVLLLDSRRIASCCANACSFHNQLIFNLLRIVATKNLMLHQKIQITANRTTREKLMAYLSAQAKQHGSRSFTIPFDRQALADYLEVDRSGLSAEISKLRKEGVLACRKNRFELLHFGE